MSHFCSLCVECFVRISEQTATFALYIINWVVFITVMESVYSAVRTDCLYKADYVQYLKVNDAMKWNSDAALNTYILITQIYISVIHIRTLTINSHNKTNKCTSNKITYIYFYHTICYKSDILKLLKAFRFVNFFPIVIISLIYKQNAHIQ